ncbi:MAG: ABC transporter ATP-binding protein [Lachnospiraceae bacterium]|nr:ABC transporter ATP-binding protein [Lachnospiraceae bacterium]
MEDIIKIERVSFKYKGSGAKLLDDVSLNVKKGETILLTGESGSGKTTLIRLINGLIPHYYAGELEGKVTVDGRDIAKTELYELAGVVGTVFQNPRSQFFSVDTDGEIVFGAENIGLEPSEIIRRKNAVIKDMHIEKLMDRSLFELSGGEKQLIACASVSALLPGIILLDEPSSNLDLVAIEKLRKQIELWKSRGITIIISEHRLWYLRDLIDRVILMKRGALNYTWTGDEFFDKSDSEIRELRLRPLSVRNYFDEVIADKSSGLSADVHGIKERVVLRDFYFSYKKKPHLIFRRHFTEKDECLSLNISRLILPKGAVIGVIGKNGTGKSTFLRCVCGLENGCKGVIECDDIVYKGRERLDLSYMVMQDVNHQLFTDSVTEEVLLSMKVKDRAFCISLLDRLGILKCKDKHPMALSGGQKQRVAIASAIAANAKLMLFDEPTSGLDYLHMQRVGELLKKLADFGNTILVATHDPEFIDMCCDYVLCIDNGTVSYMKRVNE